ncbi:MAG: polyphosphate kinase 1 [Betaproteobacteria bacterium]|nr:polyphosphate kinase 1 [Betaproteobacteria bacterium]
MKSAKTTAVSKRQPTVSAADRWNTEPDRVPPHRTDDLLNREQGLLAFNERVLAQADGDQVPLLERLRYLTIVSSNLDEFFEIRVSGLHEVAQVDDASATEARASLDAISARVNRLVGRQYALLNDALIPQLAQEGIVFHASTTWTDAHREFAHTIFQSEIEPLLTPIALDPAHPFPRILNKSLNFIVELDGQDAFGRRAGIAIVQAPRALPRLIRVPEEISGHPNGLMLLTSVVQGFVGNLFPGMNVRAVHQFRVTRNSDLFVDEEDITDLRRALQGELPSRHYGDAVRLEVSAGIGEEPLSRLLQEFELKPQDCYQVHGPVNLVRLAQVLDQVDRPDLKFPSFAPGLPGWLKQKDLFSAIRKGDVMVHQPYESFAPVMDFLSSAAIDPKVMAIKQTIYRTGVDSALMEALIAAAKAGKEVTVVVELMARFDEEANLNWAARLEQVGAHVVYGVVGHKTHAKMALITRREADGLRMYAHLGTGNYHPRTAKLYEDFGLFTANRAICADVHEIFRRLTGLGAAGALNHLWQAPFTLHQNVIAGIERETEHARAGKSARITAKMNSLLEPTVIAALYAASQAGVRIDLIIRGVCALRPGVPGQSENIVVRSIIGRFLEHSRVFRFWNDGQDEVWLSSADWMDRNFFRRVEIAFPILDEKLKARVIEEALEEHLADNTSAWLMGSDGAYQRLQPEGEKQVSQLRLLSRMGAAES